MKTRIAVICAAVVVVSGILAVVAVWRCSESSILTTEDTGANNVGQESDDATGNKVVVHNGSGDILPVVDVKLGTKTIEFRNVARRASEANWIASNGSLCVAGIFGDGSTFENVMGDQLGTRGMWNWEIHIHIDPKHRLSCVARPYQGQRTVEDAARASKGEP